MKHLNSIIAPQEEYSLKKWWRLATSLCVTFFVVTTACTLRMYRIIKNNEARIHDSRTLDPIPTKPAIPQATHLLEQITQNLPGSVAFSTVHLEPTFLLIQGKTHDQHAWAHWAEGLITLEWVTNVQVEYLQRIPKKTNEYSFSVRLSF